MIYHRLGGVPIVTLIVGEENMPFYVHLNVICNESLVFKVALSEEFTEASNQSMNIPNRLYSKQYALAKWSSEDVSITANMRYRQLAKSNTLADK